MRTVLLLPLALAACAEERAARDPWPVQVERAHGVEAWRRTRALRADVRVTFGDRKIVDHTFTFETNGPRARMESRADGVVIFDGKTAWASGKLATDPMARFHVLTWPWFIAAPFTLTGSRLSDVETRSFGGREYESALQTFAPGDGDTPDDWYRLFVDPGSKRLDAMAYIVTYGKSAEEANASPSVILYDGYADVGGVLLSHKWAFHAWDGEPKGKKGEGEVLTAAFVVPRAGTFEKTDGMVERKLP